MYSGGKPWVQALRQTLGNRHFPWYNRVLWVSLEGLEYDRVLGSAGGHGFAEMMMLMDVKKKNVPVADGQEMK